jgi:hypothetical protein
VRFPAPLSPNKRNAANVRFPAPLRLKRARFPSVGSCASARG